MEAQKFIKKTSEKKEGKTFENRVFEMREINLSSSDWRWIYEHIMNDEYELAQSNGFYESDSGFHSIDCQMVAERMSEWLEDKKDDEETLEDYYEDFQQDFKRIQKLLDDNLDFTIYYKEDDN